MRERPILFSAPMVRAIIAGTKTQTRRAVKPQPHKEPRFINDGLAITRGGTTSSIYSPLVAALCPFGEPGDRLWVRETWGLHAYGDETSWNTASCAGADEQILVDWRLTHRADWGPCQDGCHWRPSIHMPRWASRINLELTGVRIERLNDISEEDAISEGISCREVIAETRYEGGRHVEVPADRYFIDGGCDDGYESAVDAYFALWESINGAGSWSANQWVWCLSFRRLP